MIKDKETNLENTSPVLSVFIGPSNSGKTTIIEMIENIFGDRFGEIFIPDKLIQQFQKEQRELDRNLSFQEAQRRADSLNMITNKRNEYIRMRKSFLFESCSIPINSLEVARNNGFITNLYIVYLDDLDLNIERSKQRAQDGGIAVTSDFIKSNNKKITKMLNDELKKNDCIFGINNSKHPRIMFIVHNGKGIYREDKYIPASIQPCLSGIQFPEKNPSLPLLASLLKDNPLAKLMCGKLLDIFLRSKIVTNQSLTINERTTEERYK
ncbi:Predicted ABC-type ATPase [Seinonella peptonophila]|uniref:Predicted ABC-type ATPase n=1 Tax=Seinonella peptonophila TaxID=112248 RepID=A0A1M4ZNY9_9BACL|nr:hypothetical protein [Seinonella peptonophila]SHF19830.1 Predicted ABC-type ATPase [Seinonella peptonophila]